MTVKKAIHDINLELTRTLNDYYSWFDVHSDLLMFKPKVGWSIEQILEHVTLTNYFLLILIRKGKKKAIDLAIPINLEHAISNYEYNLGELDLIDKHKSFVWIRPEHMEPVGDKSVSEIKRIMEEQMNECKEILKEIPNGEGILYKTTMSVNNLGKIDVYQYIYFLCQHAKRHIAQMESVRDEYSRFKIAE
ncbi:DinB family protein [Paenibacillus sp. CGMCC 1.16610]|uniref:DinB family protein n=1 Tax=Paenibacillus anseongense TaxID=2682845 RepID=A0ABW9UB54_9BACL|nr:MULTISPECIES: DinB family protein [Paenibacillus]MBA2937564.1 DinB family protein [Paenibacillus sp. CGMCC 1.16610]MVQ36622.1 DinB family protein [Paenibacillus anseongense]